MKFRSSRSTERPGTSTWHTDSEMTNTQAHDVAPSVHKLTKQGCFIGRCSVCRAKNMHLNRRAAKTLGVFLCKMPLKKFWKHNRYPQTKTVQTRYRVKTRFGSLGEFSFQYAPDVYESEVYNVSIILLQPIVPCELGPMRSRNSQR